MTASAKLLRLRAFLASIEAPDCGCPFASIPCDWSNCRTCREAGWRRCNCPPRPPCKCPPKPICNCPPRYPPPCEHILALTHELSPDEWERMLRRAWPDEYRPRKLAPSGKLVMTRAARVALMAGRRRRGWALYHPDDLIVGDDAVRLSIFEGPRLKNGAENHRAGKLVIRRPEDAP